VWVLNTSSPITIPINLSAGIDYSINGNVNLSSSLTLPSSSNLLVTGNLTLSPWSDLYLDFGSVGSGNSSNGSAPIQVVGCVEFRGNLTITLDAAYDLNSPLLVASFSCAKGEFASITAKRIMTNSASGELCPEEIVGQGKYYTNSLVVQFSLSNICAASSLGPSMGFLLGSAFIFFLFSRSI